MQNLKIKINKISLDDPIYISLDSKFLTIVNKQDIKEIKNY